MEGKQHQDDEHAVKKRRLEAEQGLSPPPPSARLIFARVLKTAVANDTLQFGGGHTLERVRLVGIVRSIVDRHFAVDDGTAVVWVDRGGECDGPELGSAVELIAQVYPDRSLGLIAMVDGVDPMREAARWHEMATIFNEFYAKSPVKNKSISETGAGQNKTDDPTGTTVRSKWTPYDEAAAVAEAAEVADAIFSQSQSQDVQVSDTGTRVEQLLRTSRHGIALADIIAQFSEFSVSAVESGLEQLVLAGLAYSSEGLYYAI